MQPAHSRHSLGDLIRIEREAFGLSQRQLAERIDVPNSTIVRIENGQIASPRGELLNTLAEALDVSSADLFEAAGYPVPTELPSFRPYLRTKYADLPAEALAEIEATFTDIARRYGTTGPAPGEDER